MLNVIIKDLKNGGVIGATVATAAEVERFNRENAGALLAIAK